MSTGETYNANEPSITTIKSPHMQLKPPSKRKTNLLTLSAPFTDFQNKEDKGIIGF